MRTTRNRGAGANSCRSLSGSPRCSRSTLLELAEIDRKDIPKEDLAHARTRTARLATGPEEERVEGSVLSHFRIGEKLAEGGMGVVYRADDLKLGRRVAIKVLPPSLTGDASRRRRFIEEARIAAAVTHAHVATIYEVDEVDGTIFIAMEILDGASLRAYLRQHRPTIREAIRLATEIAEGLGAAHRAGIVHRDLKPDNVMVGTDGHARVLDFGLAKLLQPHPQDVTRILGAEESIHTATGQILGTPAYISPEQLRGETADRRSDIFSFGCTLHELLTGSSPFRAPTPAESAALILGGEIETASSLNPEVPAELQRILDKCLARDRDRRYRDARDLAVDLRNLEFDSGGQGVPPNRQEPLRTRTPWLVGAALLIVVVLIAGGQWIRNAREPGSAAAPSSLAIFSFENLQDPADPDRLGQILQELLITDLSSVEPVRVLSSQRLYDIKKQLDRSVEGRWSTEVATRAGAGQMLTGSLSRLGERWILAAQLIDVATGAVVQSARIDGDDFYTMVDALTAEIHEDLTLAHAAEVETGPVREKTTNSLEAYRHYLAGMEHMQVAEWEPAQERFRKAIEIDPDFGQAYYRLALANWWPGGQTDAGRYVDTLLERHLYSSSRERRLAEALQAMIEVRWNEAQNMYERLTRDYPDEKEAWYGLGESLHHAFGGGRQRDALVAFRHALELDPEFYLVYEHIFITYSEMVGVDPEHAELVVQAMADARRLLDIDPTNPTWNRYHAMAVAMQGNPDATDAAIEQALPYNLTAAERRHLYQSVYLASQNRDFQWLQDRLREIDPDRSIASRDSVTQLFLNLQFEQRDRMVFENLARHPESVRWQQSVRWIWARDWQWERAAAHAESVALANPDDAQAARRWVWRATMEGDDGGRRRAWAHATTLHTSSDEMRELYLWQSAGWRVVGDRTRALDCLERIVDLQPDSDLDVDWRRIRSLGETNRFVEARALIERVESRFLPTPDSVRESFILTCLQGDLDAAHRYFDYPPSDLALRRGVGRFWPESILAILDGDLERADRILEEGRQEMDYPRVRQWFLTGLPTRTLVQLGEWQRAAQALRLATEITPSPHALSGLALCAALSGDVAGARRSLERGLAAHPRDQDLLRTRAEVALLAGEVAEAERTAQSLLEASPQREWKYRLLGTIYAESDRYAEAIPLLERAAAMNPDRFNISSLARALVLSGDEVERGESLAREALERRWIPLRRNLNSSVGAWVTDAIIPPPSASYYPPPEEALGLGALARGRTDDAVRWLEKAAAANPNRPRIREKLRLARDG